MVREGSLYSHPERDMKKLAGSQYGVRGFENEPRAPRLETAKGWYQGGHHGGEQ